MIVCARLSEAGEGLRYWRARRVAGVESSSPRSLMDCLVRRLADPSRKHAPWGVRYTVQVSRWGFRRGKGKAGAGMMQKGAFMNLGRVLLLLVAAGVLTGCGRRETPYQVQSKFNHEFLKIENALNAVKDDASAAAAAHQVTVSLKRLHDLRRRMRAIDFGDRELVEFNMSKPVRQMYLAIERIQLKIDELRDHPEFGRKLGPPLGQLNLLINP